MLSSQLSINVNVNSRTQDSNLLTPLLMAVQSAARASSFFPGSSRHDAEQGRDGPTMARQNVAVQRKKENRRQTIAPAAQTERLRAMQGLLQHTNDKAKRKPAMRSNPDCSTAPPITL